MIKDSPLPLWLFLLLFTGLTAVFYFTSCASIKTETSVWENRQPASSAEHKVKFIFRKDYNNLNDFLKRVKLDLDFFKKQGYEIIKIEYIHTRDMTQKLLTCYAVIYYKEKR